MIWLSKAVQSTQYRNIKSFTAFSKDSRDLGRHEISNIPNADPLIPPNAGSPSFTPKKTPVDANHEFRMPIHTTDFSHGRLSTRAVIPQAAGHIVACAEERVTQMGTPCHFADSKVVTRHDCQRSVLLCETKVKCSDDFIDTCGSYYRVSILVPVMGKGLRGWGRRSPLRIRCCLWSGFGLGSVDWHRER